MAPNLSLFQSATVTQPLRPSVQLRMGAALFVREDEVDVLRASSLKSSRVLGDTQTCGKSSS